LRNTALENGKENNGGLCVKICQVIFAQSVLGNYRTVNLYLGRKIIIEHFFSSRAFFFSSRAFFLVEEHFFLVVEHFFSGVEHFFLVVEHFLIRSNSV